MKEKTESWIGKDLANLRKLNIQIKLKMLVSPNDVSLKTNGKRVKQLINALRAGKLHGAYREEIQEMFKSLQNVKLDTEFEPFEYDGGEKDENN